MIVSMARLSALVLATAATVSSVPAPSTPNVASVGGVVTMIRQCGGTMYAVGTYTSIGSPGHATVTRNRAVSFNLASGAVSSWNPNVNGEVDSIAFTPSCADAYLSGSFSRVGTKAASNIVEVDTVTGAVVATFSSTAGAKVDMLLYARGHLLAGGQFTTIGGSTGSTASFLTSLNPVSGKPDGYLKLAISGTYTKDVTHIYKMFLNPAGNRVAVDGVFTTVGGQPRRQVFVLDLGATSATLDPWYAPTLDQNCLNLGEQFYAKGLGWSPDGAFLYIASTGTRGAPLCDSVAKFSSAPSGGQTPVWINPTGCDSLYSVVAAGNDVYVGGHNRWLDNPKGCNAAGPGAVSRPGIGDVDARTGLATSWNPTRSRGHGAGDLFVDSAGDLWVSSDAPAGAVTCGGSYHPGICEFPHA